MLREGPGDLGELNRRVMQAQASVERAYETLPDRPFPGDGCLAPMPADRKAIYKARIETPIRELFPQYNEKTLDAIMSEFGLGSRTEPKRW